MKKMTIKDGSLQEDVRIIDMTKNIKASLITVGMKIKHEDTWKEIVEVRMNQEAQTFTFVCAGGDVLMSCPSGKVFEVFVQ